MEPFLGELRIFAFNFAPKGWAFCNGQVLAISQNQALFALLGTTYGGNGVQTFALPNLQGRVTVGAGTAIGGTAYPIGATGGERSHTLSLAEMPAHAHTATGSLDPAASYVATGAYPANASPTPLYSPTAPNAAMSQAMIVAFGGGAAHPNQQPFLTLNTCIAIAGIFPSRN